MAATDSQPSVICDAGPIIHLDELGGLDLLNDFHPIVVPEQVCQEVARHRPSALRRPGTELSRTPVRIDTDASFLALVQTLALAAGEQAVLSLMKEHPEAIMLTDDAAARLAALTLGYRAHGTIGVLLRAVRRGQRTQAEIAHLLRSLPSRSSLHIRPGLLQEIIDEVLR